MIQAVFVILVISGAGFAFRLLRGPSLADRIIGLNGLLLVGMGALAMHASHTDRGAFLPALVAVALVGPIGNGMIARFIERRG